MTINNTSSTNPNPNTPNVEDVARGVYAYQTARAKRALARGVAGALIVGVLTFTTVVMVDTLKEE